MLDPLWAAIFEHQYMKFDWCLAGIFVETCYNLRLTPLFRVLVDNSRTDLSPIRCLPRSSRSLASTDLAYLK